MPGVGVACPLLAAAGWAAAAPGASYRASVVEFAPELVPESPAVLPAGQALQIRQRNLARVEAYMARAKANGTQIIVFPEYGMIGEREKSGKIESPAWTRESSFPFMEQVPDPHAAAGRLNPCAQRAQLEAAAPITVGASCLAKKYSMALVLNLGDWRACAPGSAAGATKPCGSDGRVLFNTAIAFGEDGALLEKYHKHHLAGEQGHYDAGLGPQGRFRTQFGVDFGLFICADVDYAPQTGHQNVTDFAFPTFWHSDGKAHSGAIAVQTKWSKAHKVNLLAANIGYNGRISSGSGIYNAGTPLVTFYNPTMDSKEEMLTADVPINALN